MTRVAVIVLNWNGGAHLAPCLDSVAAQDHADRELLVVDNGSTDGSADRLEERHPAFRVLRLPANRGYAGGNNAGVRATTAPFVCLVNNDTVLAPGVLGALAAELADPRVAAVSPRVVYHDDPARLNAAGLAMTRAGEPVTRGRDAPDGPPYDAPAEIFGAHGACVMYRRAALDDVGLFDEDFFAYHEEFDLAWRLRRAGWTARYAPAAHLRHHEALSLRGDRPRLLYLTERNRWFALWKNASLRFLWRALPALLAVELAMLRHCLGMRTLVPLRARLDALARLGPMLARRRPGRVADAALERWIVGSR